MKAAVFYGNNRHGATWTLTQRFLEGLPDAQVSEYALPRDFEATCTGCMACVLHGEGACPHAAQLAPLRAALEEADLIVLASPVYVMGVTGAMKSFLDHLAWRFLVHRPLPAMFHKVGVCIATAAGPCEGKALRPLKEQLFFWGVARRFSLGAAVGGGWDYLSEKKRHKLTEKAHRLARRCGRAVGHATPGPATRLFFRVMCHLQRRGWSGAEQAYWAEQGWLSGQKPWQGGEQYAPNPK